MKRLILILLLVTLLLIPTAVADDAPMRKLKLEATVSGDVLDVRIYADMTYPTATAAMDSIDFRLTYASDILELIESVKDGSKLESEILDSSFFFEENTSEAGKYSVSAFSMYGNAGTGLLLHLRFRIIGEGYYGFRLGRDIAQYSLYDSASGTQTSYQLPRMDIDAEVTSSSGITDTVEEKTSATTAPVEPETEQPQTENGFIRFLRSIFGSSCFAG